MSDGASGERIGGFHAVMAAVRQARATRIWLAEGRRDGRAEALRAVAAERGIPVETRSSASLDALLADVGHQGCIAEIAPPREYHESDLPGLLAATASPWVLALDQVQDPHNLGACLRSAAAAGVTAVIAPRKRAVGLTATVRKVAVGAVECVPFVPVTNLTRALKRLQADGFWAIGLDGAAEESLYHAALRGRVLLVLGGESRGLRALSADTCDALVSIPMHDGMESLNVSVATGVALFEAARQRRLAGD